MQFKEINQDLCRNRRVLQIGGMNTVKEQIRLLIEVYELATDKQIKEFEMACDTQEDADVWAI